MPHNPTLRSCLLGAVLFAGCANGADDPAPPSGPPTVAAAVCPPPDVFDHAVCVCDDLTDVGELHVLPGPAGTGDVGVNGVTRLVAAAEAAGTWNAWGGFVAVGASIGDTLITPADTTFSGAAKVHDAEVGGNLLAVGEFDVDGSLDVGGTSQLVGGGTIASYGSYQAPSGPPCSCDPASFFDVAGAVAAAKQASNAHASWDDVGASVHHLTTGNYYVSSDDVVGASQIVIDGNVSVFVDGSLVAIGAERWKLSPGATLDLFVSGDVEAIGAIAQGSAADPSAFRLYVGGSNDSRIDDVGASAFFGSLYAPRAAINYIGDARVVGAIFARTILGVGRLELDYGTPASPPNSCDPPSDGGNLF